MHTLSQPVEAKASGLPEINLFRHIGTVGATASAGVVAAPPQSPREIREQRKIPRHHASDDTWEFLCRDVLAPLPFRSLLFVDFSLAMSCKIDLDVLNTSDQGRAE